MDIDPKTLAQLTSAISELDRTILGGDLAIIGTLAIYAGLIWYGIWVYQKRNERSADGFFSDQARKLFESGDLDALFAYCGKYYAQYPNDVMINWYLAIGYYHVGQWSKAKDYFESVIKLNPGWRDNAMPYLSEMYSVVSKTRVAH